MHACHPDTGLRRSGLQWDVILSYTATWKTKIKQVFNDICSKNPLQKLTKKEGAH